MPSPWNGFDQYTLFMPAVSPHPPARNGREDLRLPGFCQKAAHKRRTCNSLSISIDVQPQHSAASLEERNDINVLGVDEVDKVVVRGAPSAKSLPPCD